MIRVLVPLLMIALSVYALVDCIQTDDEKVKHIPKIGWIVLIVLITVVGPLAWLIAGRERAVPKPRGLQQPRAYPLAPDDDPDFLNRLGDDFRRGRHDEPDGEGDDGGDPHPRR